MLNKVVLIGRLTRDVELSRCADGKSYANLDIAVDDGYGDKRQTYFFKATAFGKTADNLANYTHKGSLISICGRLVQYKYTSKKTNQQVTSVEITIETADFLDTKNSTPKEDMVAKNDGDDGQPIETEDKSLSKIDVVDDDLPF